MSPNFFILISCCVFVFIFMKKLWPNILELIDSHITNIKNEFLTKEATISEHEKLKFLYQERLQHLHKEIDEHKSLTEEKLNFLKIKLTNELDLQYEYRQKNFKQAVHRIQLQQRKILKTKCVEEILRRIDEQFKKNPSFNDEYMISLLKTISD